jgi:hypothetical protein
VAKEKTFSINGNPNATRTSIAEAIALIGSLWKLREARELSKVVLIGVEARSRDTSWIREENRLL